MLARFLALRAPLGAVFALAAVNTLDAEPSAPAGLVGHYRVQGPGMIIAIADCGEGRLCGRIAGLAPQQQQNAQQRLAPQQADQLCGLTVLTELRPTAIGWQGKFRDPILGGDYTLDISRGGAKSGPALMVQRYSAPPFLTRSMARIEAWVSVAPPSTPCGTATPTS
jgi:Uncharacterized protein conserved in bacteria (DUF2147)